MSNQQSVRERVAIYLMDKLDFGSNSAVNVANSLGAANLLATEPDPLNGWRPISEAPRDGTRFIAWLAFGKSTIGWYVNGAHFAAESLGGGGNSADTTPTHWQPLPATPQEQGEV